MVRLIPALELPKPALRYSSRCVSHAHIDLVSDLGFPVGLAISEPFTASPLNHISSLLFHLAICRFGDFVTYCSHLYSPDYEYLILQAL